MNRNSSDAVRNWLGFFGYLDETNIRFQPQPHSNRGTVGIVILALTTIVLSVWTSIHPNLDKYPTDHHQVYGQRIFRTLTDHVCHYVPWMETYTRRRILSASLCLLLPEITCLQAVKEYLLATHVLRSTQAVPGWEKFTLEQAHLVVMGGIQLLDLSEARDFACYVRINHEVLNIDMIPNKDKIAKRCRSGQLDKLITLGNGIYFFSHDHCSGCTETPRLILERHSISLSHWRTFQILHIIFEATITCPISP